MCVRAWFLLHFYVYENFFEVFILAISVPKQLCSLRNCMGDSAEIESVVFRIC